MKNIAETCERHYSSHVVNYQFISELAASYVDGKSYVAGPIRKVAYRAYVAGAINTAAERDRLLDLVKRIQDALGTGETGDNLVAVACDAHHAEMELAAINADKLEKKA